MPICHRVNRQTPNNPLSSRSRERTQGKQNHSQTHSCEQSCHARSRGQRTAGTRKHRAAGAAASQRSPLSSLATEADFRREEPCSLDRRGKVGKWTEWHLMHFPDPPHCLEKKGRYSARNKRHVFEAERSSWASHRENTGRQGRAAWERLYIRGEGGFACQCALKNERFP